MKWIVLVVMGSVGITNVVVGRVGHNPNNDSLRHYYKCHPLTAAATQTLNQQHLPSTRAYFFLAHNYNNTQGKTELYSEC